MVTVLTEHFQRDFYFREFHWFSKSFKPNKRTETDPCPILRQTTATFSKSPVEKFHAKKRRGLASLSETYRFETPRSLLIKRKNQLFVKQVVKIPGLCE